MEKLIADLSIKIDVSYFASNMLINNDKSIKDGI